jgi:hypothetical protein
MEVLLLHIKDSINKPRFGEEEIFGDLEDDVSGETAFVLKI